MLKGGFIISILQKYEENKKIIGIGRIHSMSDYIEFCNNNGRDISYSSLIDNKKEYDKFTNWFEKQIKPFYIMKHSDDLFSVSLSNNDFWYDWIEERKIIPNHYGDGYCYEDAFKNYLEDNFKYNYNFDINI